MSKIRIVGKPDVPPGSYTPPILDPGVPPPQAVNRTASFTLKGGRADDNKPIPMITGTCDLPLGSIRYARVWTSTLWIVRLLALGEREATARGGEQGGKLDGLVNIHTAAGDILNSFLLPNRQISDNFSYTFHPGSLDQVVDVDLHAVDPSFTYNFVVTDWTGKRRALAYIVERYAVVATNFPSGPPDWIYRLKGSQMFDPRNGLTRYTENTFVQQRFWELDPEGAYKRLDQIDDVRFTAAANIAEQVTDNHTPRFTSHFLIAAATSDVRKTFRTLSMSSFPPIENKWGPICDRPADPVMVLDETNLATGDVSAEPNLTPDQRINHVIVEFTDTSHFLWTVGGPGGTIDLRTDALIAGLEEDRSMTLILPHVHDQFMAMALAYYQLYSYQGDFHLKLAWKAIAGSLKLGDVVTQKIDSWARQYVCRIGSREKRQDGTYNVDLQRIDTRKWNDIPTPVPSWGGGGGSVSPPVGDSVPTALASISINGLLARLTDARRLFLATPVSILSGSHAAQVWRAIDLLDLPAISAANLTDGTTGTGAIVLASAAPGLAPVQSVAGRTGNVVIGEGDVTGLTGHLAAKAPLASPVFSGLARVDQEDGGLIIDAAGLQRYGIVKTSGFATEFRFLSSATIGWRFRRVTSGTLLSPSASDVPLEVDASGNLLAANGLKERGLAAPLGEWTSFTPSRGAGAGTWTGGSVNTAKYAREGKKLTVAVDISGSSVSNVTTTLTMTIPGLYAANTAMKLLFGCLDSNVVGNAVAIVASGSTVLTLAKDITQTGAWAVSLGTTSISFVFVFEIQ